MKATVSSIKDRLLKSKIVRGLAVAVVTVTCFFIWTAAPTPSSAQAQTSIASAMLSPGQRWASAVTQTDRQYAVGVTAGQPLNDPDGEFSGYEQQKNALVGSADCSMTIWNVFGVAMVGANVESDYLIDAHGVTLANNYFFPAGRLLYRASEVNEVMIHPFGNPFVAMLKYGIDVALGSSSGASVKNYIVYLLLTIYATGQITCQLKSRPDVL